MTNGLIPQPQRRIGIDRDALRVSALASLARHSAHDTVLVACSLRAPIVGEQTTVCGLDAADIDGLSVVVRELAGRHLDLILHGSGGSLDAGSELVSLLRGRYHTLRAIVPNAALAMMSLIAMACDTAVMPDTAILGTEEDRHQPKIPPDEAAEWVIRNCPQADSGDRAKIASTLFSEADGPKSPITAAHARDLGLAIHLVGQRSGIGADVRMLGESLERGERAGSYSTTIANHRGTCYVVEV